MHVRARPGSDQQGEGRAPGPDPTRELRRTAAPGTPRGTPGNRAPRPAPPRGPGLPPAAAAWALQPRLYPPPDWRLRQSPGRLPAAIGLAAPRYRGPARFPGSFDHAPAGSSGAREPTEGVPFRAAAAGGKAWPGCMGCRAPVQVHAWGVGISGYSGRSAPPSRSPPLARASQRRGNYPSLSLAGPHLRDGLSPSLPRNVPSTTGQACDWASPEPP